MAVLERKMYNMEAELVLASSSPRRGEMLSRLGLEFSVVPSGLGEDHDIGLAPAELAEHWADAKTRAVAEKSGAGSCCLGADTIVVLGDNVLGKPDSEERAKEYLRMLSGREHEVISAYSIIHPRAGAERRRVVSSRVKIRELAPAEIAAYVATGEPMDKAGAYGVQGVGAFMVESITGSYTNVVGLPLAEVVIDLAELGVISPAGGGGGT